VRYILEVLLKKIHRRQVVVGMFSSLVIGCTSKSSDWCESPSVNDDGEFPEAGSCQATVEEIEGPYYLADAPERTDLHIFGDEGTLVTMSGTIFIDDCTQGMAGAIIEFWHADPDGDYDNTSSEMRYRCRIITDSQGRYQLQTLLPGRYKNGLEFRPRHIHVKVFDSDNVERLTTQLYFEGDPYIECDSFAHTSNVVPFTGSEETELLAESVDFVIV